MGRKLFHDPALSSDGSVSCASCHNLENYGVDSLPVSVGVKGRMGTVNAPTVYNAVFNLSQFWDGRADTLQEQAEGPLQTPHEMNSSFPAIIAYLEQSEEYRLLFRKAYGGAITKTTITDAIAEFEKTLITPDSPFDRYLKGESNALDATAKEGFAVFRAKGCVACHNGVNLGGNLYQKAGVIIPMTFEGPPWEGRYDVTKEAEDRYYFKVPSLRNVTRTAPYFHDGSVPTLKEAIRDMAWHQLGRHLKNEEVEQIVHFLTALEAPLPPSVRASR